MRVHPRPGLVAAALSAIALVALGTAAQPTAAVWEDRGGATLSVAAIAQAPPAMDSPIVATDPQTVLLTQTAVGSGNNYQGEPTPVQFCFSEDVKTTSVTDAKWSITLHTMLPPFNGVTPNNIYTTWGYQIVPAADYATSGDLIVTPGQTYQYASTTKAHTFKFCANTPEPAWQPPGSTTYALTGLTLSTDTGMACVTTVTTGYKLYYIGFTATFDYKALLDRERAANRITQAQYDDFIDNRYWSGPDGQGATGSNYSVTLTGYSPLTRAVRQSIPTTMKVCSY